MFAIFLFKNSWLINFSLDHSLSPSLQESAVPPADDLIKIFNCGLTEIISETSFNALTTWDWLKPEVIPPSFIPNEPSKGGCELYSKNLSR